ncbi:Dyp-type peroxidase [Acinetobacter larvae]|uniref:Peroxidase n=1 Tax=Acinetobacter larvae TaxID=1789224 RepID=A0A1B2LVV9_9GAMM|nr:Dyp-type peroxidase [Acinetobacter larvae]AOA57092.1 peroxidase [Acinetobacter larvae]
MTAQSLILPLPSPHARYLVLNLTTLSLEELKKKLTQLLSTRDRLITQDPKANLKTVIAFGTQLWSQLYPERPAGFHDLAAIDGPLPMPARAADLFIHIAADREDFCFILSQCFFEGIREQIEVLNERVGFRYLDSRDLTGFIDGTENPQQLDERAETTLLDAQHGVFQDSSFVFVQRYVHHLDRWQKLSVDHQEKVIGRSKLESIEMADDVKPDDAHIARVVIEDDAGEELEILRHSLPYGEGHGEQGLFFVAYTRDLNIIDRMLGNMFGHTADGINDHLMRFTTPVDGAYFFVPSQQLLEDVIDAD